MALCVQEASSSNTSNPTPLWKFHIFLSFMGQDTRKGFTDHLYAALWRKGIITFRDDEGLERGEDISHELLKAIEDSLCAIVVLSPNYASSKWCLDELQKILECRSKLGQEVFPIFYEVDPSVVRNQRESFAEDLNRHEETFRENKEKVQRWREALREVANLSGWDSRGWHENDLIENHIVETIWSKLQPKLPSYNDTLLVGIDSRIYKVYSHLEMWSDDVRFVGIWGMGGIGKTTLARVVYERINSQFEICCFLANVREVSERDGLVHLQRKLLSHFRLRSMVINDTYEGKKTIKNLFCNKKVLLVLDDVSSISQLEKLAESKEWFGARSRVIITTRNIHLLISHGVPENEIYRIEIMNEGESLQLLSREAFKRNHPHEDYLELSNFVVQYAGGLPLALKVLGSFLCGRSVLEWEDALEKLKKIPNYDVLKVLKISYDGLEDEEKTIFLDIACFFKGWSKNKVTHLLKICGLHVTIGLSVLIEKSLLIEKDVCEGKYLEMHDLLQEMGRNIVFQESPNNVGRRSRLWSLEDIDQVLKRNMGTKEIQAMVLQWQEPYEAHWDLKRNMGIEGMRAMVLHWQDPYEVHRQEPYEAHWDPEAFSKMCNLRLLIISSNLHLSYGLKCLSSALKVLAWWRYPLKALPLETPLDNLVDIKMPFSKIKQLWNGKQRLGKLKSIDLSHSKYLIKTPNFSEVPNLESLILESCISLVEVHPSLGECKKLCLVNLKDCRNLKILPKKLEMNALMELVLCGCSKVKKLPMFGESMENLSLLDLEGTTIVELPESLGFLTGLLTLNLKGCKNLICLPHSFHNLKHLKVLNVSGCLKFSQLPESLNENEALEGLDASETNIKEVPSSIVQLRNLKKLSFYGCKGSSYNFWRMFRRHTIPMGLVLPSSLSPLTSLTELNLSHCSIGDRSIPHDFGCLSSLSKLDLRGNNFVNLPACFVSNLLRLQYLDLSCSPRLQSLPKLPPGLIRLNAEECASMEPLSDEKLWYLFASLDHQHRHQDRVLNLPYCVYESWLSEQFHGEDFIATMPGSEIPSWFHNQNYSRHPEGETILGVSIVVDISPSCRASEWSGIAVCLVLDDMFDRTIDVSSASHRSSIIWHSPALEDNEYMIPGWGYAINAGDYPHLCIMFLHCNDKACRQHLRVNGNQFLIRFFTEELFYRTGPAKIKKCGWRVLCKEDILEWCRTRS